MRLLLCALKDNIYIFAIQYTKANQRKIYKNAYLSCKYIKTVLVKESLKIFRLNSAGNKWSNSSRYTKKKQQHKRQTLERQATYSIHKAYTKKRRFEIRFPYSNKGFFFLSTLRFFFNGSSKHDEKNFKKKEEQLSPENVDVSITVL